MSKDATLEASLREERGKGPARRLRAAGKVPAVVYGGDAEPVTVTLDAGEAFQLFQSISVDNTIVSLTIDGEDPPIPTLVREIQTDPVRPDLLHVDFYRIQEGMEVEVDVPVHLNGVPEGVKAQGGILQQVIHELPVRCVPSQIPETYEIDVTELEMGDSIHVDGIPVQEGVTILLDLDRTVCSVVAPKALEVEEEEPEEELEALLAEEGEIPPEELEELEEGEEVAEGAEEEPVEEEGT